MLLLGVLSVVLLIYMQYDLAQQVEDMPPAVIFMGMLILSTINVLMVLFGVPVPAVSVISVVFLSIIVTLFLILMIVWIFATDGKEVLFSLLRACCLAVPLTHAILSIP